MGSSPPLGVPMTSYRFQLRLWRELRSEVVGRTHGQPKSRRVVRSGGGVRYSSPADVLLQLGFNFFTRPVSIHTSPALREPPRLWSASFFVPTLLSFHHFLTYFISILRARPHTCNTSPSNPGLCTYIDENDVRQQGIRIGHRVSPSSKAGE